MAISVYAAHFHCGPPPYKLEKIKDCNSWEEASKAAEGMFITLPDEEWAAIAFDTSTPEDVLDYCGDNEWEDHDTPPVFVQNTEYYS